MKDEKKQPIFYAELSLMLGGALLVFSASLFGLSLLALLAHLAFSGIFVPSAFLLTSVYLLITTTTLQVSRRRKYWILVILLFVVLLIVHSSLAIAQRFLDVSFDGQTYQQEAVIRLVEGWNPLIDFSHISEDPNSEMKLFSDEYYIYPKFPWMSWAALSTYASDIESGKALHLILIFASFFICVGVLGRISSISKTAVIALALVAVINPIAICQSLSFYVDGILASTYLCLFACTALAVLIPGPHSVFLFLTAIVLCINVKFLTGLVYVTILLVGTVGFLLWRYRTRGTFLLKLSAIGLFLGIGVFGFHPWITTVLYRPQILHNFMPYSSSGVTPKNLVLFKGQLPENFVQLNRYEKFIFSLFARPDNPHRNQHAVINPVFKLPLGQLPIFALPDTRVGGFGPFFPWILLLSVILMSCVGRTNKKVFWETFFFPLLILFSVLVNPESWWARYVPHLWLFPLVVATLILSQKPPRFVTCFAATVLVLLLLNSASIAVVYYHAQWRFTKMGNNEIAEIASLPQPVEVVFGRFRANRERLRTHGIEYKEVSRLSCAKVTSLVHSHTRICPRRSDDSHSYE